MEKTHHEETHGSLSRRALSVNHIDSRCGRLQEFVETADLEELQASRAAEREAMEKEKDEQEERFHAEHGSDEEIYANARQAAEDYLAEFGEEEEDEDVEDGDYEEEEEEEEDNEGGLLPLTDLALQNAVVRQSQEEEGRKEFVTKLCMLLTVCLQRCCNFIKFFRPVTECSRSHMHCLNNTCIHLQMFRMHACIWLSFDVQFCGQLKPVVRHLQMTQTLFKMTMNKMTTKIRMTLRMKLTQTPTSLLKTLNSVSPHLAPMTLNPPRQLQANSSALRFSHLSQP